MAKNGTTVTQIAKEVTDLVIRRAAADKNYGRVSHTVHAVGGGWKMRTR